MQLHLLSRPQQLPGRRDARAVLSFGCAVLAGWQRLQRINSTENFLPLLSASVDAAVGTVDGAQKLLHRLCALLVALQLCCTAAYDPSLLAGWPLHSTAVRCVCKPELRRRQQQRRRHVVAVTGTRLRGWEKWMIKALLDPYMHDMTTGGPPNPVTLQATMREIDRTIDVTNGADSFADLLLPEHLLAALAAAGFTKPSPVQTTAIPLARVGADLIVQAKSGTGKTLVYGIPCVEKAVSEQALPQARACLHACTVQEVL